MASQKSILKVLDILTMATKSRPRAMGLLPAAANHRLSIRSIIDSRNIVGIGISNKTTNKKNTGTLALTFYVEKKMALKKLKGHEVIPPAIPCTLSGQIAIPTDVVVLGKLQPQVNATRDFFQPGNSIGHIDDDGAGTFGAVVFDQNNELFILSNSHVLAQCGRAILGDEILYPGSWDSGFPPDDTRANLHSFIPFDASGEFVNLVDCALAKPTAAQLGNLMAEIKDLGLPAGTIQAKKGMNVVKVGRSTEKTTSEVLDVNFRFVFDYRKLGLRTVGFRDQILCRNFTDQGDSGSLVVDQETGKAVGLHFAGAPEGSVINPISEVLGALNVQLVTRSLISARRLAPPLALPQMRAIAGQRIKIRRPIAINPLKKKTISTNRKQKTRKPN